MTTENQEAFSREAFIIFFLFLREHCDMTYNVFDCQMLPPYTKEVSFFIRKHSFWPMLNAALNF